MGTLLGCQQQQRNNDEPISTSYVFPTYVKGTQVNEWVVAVN